MIFSPEANHEGTFIFYKRNSFLVGDDFEFRWERNITVTGKIGWTKNKS